MPLKACKQCGEQVGVRTLSCPECGFEFIPSKKPKQIDWRELKKGNRIQIVNGSGPYMIKRHKDGREEKVCIGSNGKFTVQAVASNGLHCHGKSGYEFVYMGAEEPETKLNINIHKAPHKIRILKDDPRHREKM